MKMKKRKILNKQNINLSILLIGFFCSFIGLFLVFVLGFHSFDMAQNLIFIRDDVKIDLLEEGINWSSSYFETKLSGEMISLENAYSSGIKYFINGIVVAMMGFMIMGYGLGKLEK